MEKWKPCVGFDQYEVSNLGRVRRCVDSRKYKAGYILAPRKHPRGYVQVSLAKDGKTYYRLVHRLVAEAFLGPQPQGCEVAHGDGTRTNNVLGNLRWATPRENQMDRFKHGTDSSGERQGSSRMKEADILDIRRCVEAGSSQADMCRKYGLSAAHVHRIVKGTRWSHV